MGQELNHKIENFLNEFESSGLVEQYKKQKKKVLDNPSLLRDIKKYQETDKYDPLYKKLKMKLFQNEAYKKYLELEQELYYLTLEMTQKLKELIK